ncbi:hypothetical protein O6H91_07G027800 [Diphasiastrum complanatum]|uniref:Uncharacterized protein n=1 Tax=Diphasiastrum complanatum TaxID=34168 RepID=A0ACC2D3H4_DIPCM|nr:hypothetical protein O6H91_Y332500 [Diphasiastrum complanatum]KAJ7548796.1 hypothetical protein O6H91_07G027800 [Diphasiastrum complanatum]
MHTPLGRLLSWERIELLLFCCLRTPLSCYHRSRLYHDHQWSKICVIQTVNELQSHQYEFQIGCIRGQQGCLSTF